MKVTRFLQKYSQFRNALKHEYRNIFGDAGVILIVIGAIFIYGTVYSLAYKNEVLRDVPIAVVDHSKTPSSRQLIRLFDATPNLAVAYKPGSLEEAKSLFLGREINGIIVIPPDYEKKLLRAEKINLPIYADASYFLMYRQVFQDVLSGVVYSGASIEWMRFVSKGAGALPAKTLSNPIHVHLKNMYNPYGGYASFIIPVILIVIIQQTLLIGIGMVGGTWREKGLYTKLIPANEKRLAVFPLVLGKSLPYISIYCVTMLYFFGFHYKLFGYPMNGSFLDISLFLTPYLLSCIFLGIALSSLFKHRENSLLLLLFTSVPVVMISGASVPMESMPEWLYNLGKIIPSSSGINGFIRLQTMGANLSDVATEYRTLWVLTGVYLVLACLGIRRVLHRVEREKQNKSISE